MRGGGGGGFPLEKGVGPFKYPGASEGKREKEACFGIPTGCRRKKKGRICCQANKARRWGGETEGGRQICSTEKKEKGRGGPFFQDGREGSWKGKF